jgi:hypothetical protein
MKVTIEVADRKEADAIRQGLLNPEVRAFVKVMGVLAGLPSDRARERVLRFVDDKCEEETPRYVSVFR